MVAQAQSLAWHVASLEAGSEAWMASECAAHAELALAATAKLEEMDIGTEEPLEVALPVVVQEPLLVAFVGHVAQLLSLALVAQPCHSLVAHPCLWTWTCLFLHSSAVPGCAARDLGCAGRGSSGRGSSGHGSSGHGCACPGCAVATGCDGYGCAAANGYGAANGSCVAGGGCDGDEAKCHQTGPAIF